MPADLVKATYRAARLYVDCSGQSFMKEALQAYGMFRKVCGQAGLDYRKVLLEVRTEKARAVWRPTIRPERYNWAFGPKMNGAKI